MHDSVPCVFNSSLWEVNRCKNILLVLCFCKLHIPYKTTYGLCKQMLGTLSIEFFLFLGASEVSSNFK